VFMDRRSPLKCCCKTISLQQLKAGVKFEERLQSSYIVG
jgi:hypothetical protein